MEEEMDKNEIKDELKDTNDDNVKVCVMRTMQCLH